jgi:hypothetical protein
VGFLAGSLLLGIPYLFSQLPLMLTDLPAMFFLTLSIYTFIKTMEKGGIWIFISSAAIFCAVLSKYSAWMMLSVLPVIFIIYLIEDMRESEIRSQKLGGPEIIRNPKSEIRNFIYRGISVAFIAGALVAIVVFYKFDVISHQMKFLQEYQAPGLKRWGESFVSTFLFQIHPLITLAAIYSVYEAFKKRDLKFLIPCWLIFLVVLLQIRRSRYIMIIFPMLTLMASYGMQNIKNVELRRFIAFSIISSSLVVAIMVYLPFLQRMSTVNLKDAGAYLDSIEEKGAEVFTIPSKETIVNVAVAVPMLDLFTGKDIYYNHDAAYSPSFEEIKESPLRFTWEYKNPRYYSEWQKNRAAKTFPALGRGPLQGQTTLVIISNGDIKSLPDQVAEKINGYKEKRVFDTSEGIFGFNPVVTVYLPSIEKP